MNNFKQVKETYKEKYKGFGSYTECMTRALFTGLSSFALSGYSNCWRSPNLQTKFPHKAQEETSFSALYFAQVLLKSRLPYPPKFFLMLPVAVSTPVSWTITSRRTQYCQDAWVGSEPHYTDFNEK